MLKVIDQVVRDIEVAAGSFAHETTARVDGKDEIANGNSVVLV